MKIRYFIGIFVALLMSAVSATAQDGYRIRAGDTLGIEVLEDPGLNRSVLVLPDGRFSFPFAGTIKASGRTIGEVQQAIIAAIAPNFSVSPNVFVSVDPGKARASSGGGGSSKSSRKIDVFFLGEVASPGEKQLSRGTTFLQAMAASGGFSKFAATKRVQLRRTDRNGKQTLRTINYKAFTQGTAVGGDFRLQDGDVILVPERRLFE